ncbi:DUF397 domain-containing protein [Cryptosporangium aurantiacum]|uniref:DUF397 domain-containing protein n=1 Tax=Cryptosporangium aurantiacum TaxID=134849 RepID=A0A1M7RI93_9ACTN|nr:DUF397 domain-containing protein [Cryptosporangium aurantiacum]SHN45926.1 protein of unknown function [Cryptosporangium aurantiacum]
MRPVAQRPFATSGADAECHERGKESHFVRGMTTSQSRGRYMSLSPGAYTIALACGQSNCVEVRAALDRASVEMGSTVDRNGVRLVFSAQTWRDFLKWILTRMQEWAKEHGIDHLDLKEELRARTIDTRSILAAR